MQTALAMSNSSHHVHRGSKDLFKHKCLLGRGNSSVDEVERSDRPGRSYARKTFVIQLNVDKSMMTRIHNEVAIMKRLRHDHVIFFKGSYEWEGRPYFYVLMAPVATMNLQTFLSQVDRLDGNHQSRIQQCRSMRQWVPCLIRALSYVHSMTIRHKDIKPANLLIESNGNIILADFGISNDCTGLTTTGTNGQAAATLMYAAPEVVSEQRRGRSADFFSLGCVILEMCTVASGIQDSLQMLRDHLRNRRPATVLIYSEHPFPLLDWICLNLNAPPTDPDMGEFIRFVLQLVFLILDPDGRLRITARQLADMLSDDRCQDFRKLGAMACQRCRDTAGSSPQDTPVHSVFKSEPPNLKAGLSQSTPGLWEKAKERWLLEHIWWANDSVVS